MQFVMTNLVGKMVNVQTKDGKCWEGILCSHLGDGKIVLNMVKEQVAPDAKAQRPIHEKAFEKGDMVRITARDVDLYNDEITDGARRNRGALSPIRLRRHSPPPSPPNAPTPPPSPHRAPLARLMSPLRHSSPASGEVVADTEIEIAGGRSEYGAARELQAANAWLDPAAAGDGALGFSSDQKQRGQWDQFDTNEKLGARTTYSDDLCAESTAYIASRRGLHSISAK